MVSAIISRVVILLFGTLYPAYASYKAVKTKNVKEYVKWMMYWIVFAFFSCIETFLDFFVAWIPFYYELKILFVLWLLSPATKGASILYRKFIHPQLAKRETEIDKYLAKASDQGYKTLYNLGTQGFNYATNVVLSTAMKGQSKIVDQLKKSYSLNDLSQPDAGGNFQMQREEITEDEDELDNRMIEESYQSEMLEKEMSEDDNRRRHHSKDSESYDDEADEKEHSSKSGKSQKAYSHKEAYHYGTLPRTRKSNRSSLKRSSTISQ